jgi:hypothetical protein
MGRVVASIFLGVFVAVGEAAVNPGMKPPYGNDAHITFNHSDFPWSGQRAILIEPLNEPRTTGLLHRERRLKRRDDKCARLVESTALYK